MRTTHRAARAALTTLALTTALGATALTTTACSPSKESDSATSSQSPTSEATPHSTSVELRDGWAKATDSDMTAVFGMLHNGGTADATLVSAHSDVAGMTQLHETVSGASGMQMQEKKGGFVIPAGGDLALAPGGNHVMLMQLKKPITTGTQVEVTLQFADGTTQTVTAPARSFAGAEEHYGGGDGMTGGMSGASVAPGGHGH